MLTLMACIWNSVNLKKKFSKRINQENITRKLKPKIYSPNVDENITVDSIQISKSEIPSEILDSNLTTVSDTLKYYTNLIDSLVVNYPNLIAIKSAMAEHIKKNPQIETDSSMVVRRMRKYMIDYYKFKYPTPLSKFGDGNPGIPIDKILDLFSRDDTVDVKRIKKYLGLDTKIKSFKIY